MHRLEAGLYGDALWMMDHLMVNVSLLFFRCQMYFESSVELDRDSFLKDWVWLPSLSLKVVLVSPIYSLWCEDSVVTVALYTMFLAKQLPSSGQLALDLLGQLHVLSGSVVGVAFRIFLLWLLIMLLTLSVHE